MNNPDKIRFKNLLSEADHAAHYGDEKKSSTLLCEAMLIIHRSIAELKDKESKRPPR